MPVVHCERCGREAAAEVGSYEYCVKCGLYVCAASCWRASGFCSSCAPTVRRRTVERDVALLRRVDRRLQELRREVLTLASGSRRVVGSDDARLDLACLEIKYGSAVRVHHRILGQRISAKRREKLAPLSARIQSNADASLDALGRAAAALNAAAPAPGRSQRLGQSVADALQRSMRPPIIASAAAVVLLLVVVYAVLPDSTPRAEGVLSGVQPPPSVAPPPPADAGSPTAAASPLSSPAPAIANRVEMDFDGERIGPFEADGWHHSGGVVEVAAYPTPFDRSIVVTSVDGQQAETCFRFSDGSRLLSLGVDFAVDGETGATVTLRDEAATPLVALDLGEDGTAVTRHDGTRLASEEGVDPDAWYSLGIEESAGEVVVAVAPGGEGSEPILTATTTGPLRVTSICFGAGAANASAYYDNLRLEYERSSA